MNVFEAKEISSRIQETSLRDFAIDSSNRLKKQDDETTILLHDEHSKNTTHFESVAFQMDWYGE